MSAATWLPALTSVLALVFALALIDQWRDRRHGFQLVWAAGMLFYGVAAGCEAIAGAAGWSEALYRTWYLTGALWTAGWLGLGTAFLLGRTRFGYSFATILILAGLATFFSRTRPDYANSGAWPVVYLVGALVIGAAIAVETYFADERWPALAAVAIVGATLLSIVLMVATTLPAPGYYVDPATGLPGGNLIPGYLRLLTPLLNITGGLSLFLGAIFSAYVFMPKRRVLAYSLDPSQPGDQFLFNLAIALPAIAVNFVASLPGAVRALIAGKLHSRVPATILIAIGAIIPTITDELLVRFGYQGLFELGKLFGVVFLFAGFLVSAETFREIRVPFTHIRLRPERSQQLARDAASEAES